MIQYLLFVASPSQIDGTKQALARLGAVMQETGSNLPESFELKHHLLGQLVLRISLLSNLEGVTPHLRRYPVDLLIYDERGEDSLEATEAIGKIRKDVLAFAQLWGPDFLFPMSRVVAIIDDDKGPAAHRSFELGRDHIREVCIAPRNLGATLKWIKGVLDRGVIRKNKVGMALSGGGVEGFLYQVGALFALESALEGKTIYDCDSYSGVSSGSLGASLLVNRVPYKEIIKSLHHNSDFVPPLTSRNIFSFATGDITKRAFGQFAAGITEFDLQKWLKRALKSVPTGFFKGETIETYIRTTIKHFGGKNSFSELKTELFIGATDQDSFQHIIFGKKPWQDVPISQAVRASCAFPPVFTPVEIGGRYFIDGQVTKSCNVEELVRAGCSFIFIIDPLQPFATQIPGSVDQQGGVYALIQVVKAIVYSRFHATLTHLTERYPDVDFIVLQPDEHCAELMAGSPMRYKLRLPIVEAAFKGTLRRLRERHHVYSGTLAKYGFRLSDASRLLKIEREGHEIISKAS